MTIYHKPDHALYCILTILYLFLEPIGFCFSLYSFPRIEHLITICGHHHHHVCHPCSTLDVDITYLMQNTRIEVTPLCCLNYPKPNIGLSGWSPNPTNHPIPWFNPPLDRIYSVPPKLLHADNLQYLC
jgi:hypothetical protein